MNTPEINLEFEGGVAEILELYTLQKQILKESPALIAEFMKTCFDKGYAFDEYVTAKVRSNSYEADKEYIESITKTLVDYASNAQEALMLEKDPMVYIEIAQYEYLARQEIIDNYLIARGHNPVSEPAEYRDLTDHELPEQEQ